jgi:hypothetical protein
MQVVSARGDHENLTYRCARRDFRPTDVNGQVIHDILS